MAMISLEVTKKVAFIPMIKVHACNRLIKHTFKITFSKKDTRKYGKPQNFVGHFVIDFLRKKLRHFANGGSLKPQKDIYFEGQSEGIDFII